MADSTSSCNGRKCFDFGFVRVGSWGSSPRKFLSTSSIHGAPEPVPESVDNWSTATIVVVTTAVFFVLGMFVIAIVLRKRRIQADQARRAETGNVAAKDGQGDEDVNNHGQWSAGTVELVVMAGDTQPTYFARPTPAPSPSPHLILCPPLMFPESLPH